MNILTIAGTWTSLDAMVGINNHNNYTIGEPIIVTYYNYSFYYTQPQAHRLPTFQFQLRAAHKPLPVQLPQCSRIVPSPLLSLLLPLLLLLH